ncbi:DUF3048 domain-containing protein [Ruminococcus sp.]|uniref:DUF3048 domain-containing protein n=1 Tax=Ruminococcus sp. TaxID=41978 RepID=UPI0025CCCEC4|nr:DUF3048 domain-containing protein [Ruminococcus sp.]MCI5815928.1 DUF3048 domain-containing protein [Ruminococcus sp.]MDY4963906.1 DUF3048 domain-containing protein [Ruminococcus callidus]
MKIRKLFAGLMACLLLGAAGCGNQQESAGTVQETSAARQTELATEPTEPATEAAVSVYNPLTGEAGYNPDAVGKRPIAVMVNNVKPSLPQYGIAAADIIYEIPVEGGITRLMAVYADYTQLPDICSVRSCRYYYPILAYGMDAIYCHWGCDQTIAKDTLARLGIDRMDGGGAANKVVFFRDSDRVGKYNTEHTGYLKGSAVPDAIAQFGFRTDTTVGNAFHFLDPEQPEKPEGKSCSTVNAAFSDQYYSTFTFDKASGTYLKQHSGKPHMDQKADKQLAFTNVLILQTDIHTRPDGYLMDVALEGGTGYYISMGAAQEIQWTKDGEDQPIRLFDKAGKELSVNAGKSYIGLIGTKRPVTIS